ncbi:hypothetical protein LZC95_51565 [Pendulispora brunnea]|uniref:Uncharacterized protein n=1 Tax=Pendulispora brunnea TaxID=2905690 RepID=A0ABZ2K9V4_9BACT
MKQGFLVALPLALVALPACSVQTSDGTGQERTGSVEQREVWSAADDPALFGVRLERVAATLPTKGEAAQTPWAGSYWPAYNDSINYRWNGPDSLSPSEKYETAFGVSGVQDQVAASNGVESVSARGTCTSDTDCNDGTACGKRNGASAGRCVLTWAGICHGWTPASILVPEPKHGVVENGVTFEVQDIKALLSMLYTEADTKLISLRCNQDSADLSRDKYGRPPSRCRDTNPGTLHLLLTNYLGLLKQSFAEDRTFDSQVWNQPIRSYEIKEQKPVSAEEANRLVMGNTSSPIPAAYAFNSGAKSFLYVKTRVAYIGESDPDEGNLSSTIDRYTHHDDYSYVLELDARGAIIGGEWVGHSKNAHPDFLWLPKSAPTHTVSGISPAHVKKLADASIANR